MIKNNLQKQRDLLRTYNMPMEIVKKITTVDEEGYKKEDYKVIYKCFGNINNLYGKELYNAFGIGLENTLNIRIKYCNLLKEIFFKSDNKNREYKVKWNNIIFDIFLVDFLGFNNEDVILKVRRLD
ncbi:phage head closure protein [Clostridium tarantellae]|uniref:Phage head closure protein n=1 Tax=Clostridium tarantellae TaxID=39493 RepID=A0A6I1MRE3_9CLOT|nr:phage head closure protein [Clostridium tarantellae]MPQ45280.1 phage head closure protein [Clostridium tarantellae]